MPDLTTMLLVDEIDASPVAKGVPAPLEKDWDHMNPASRKAYGLSGRAQASEKSRKLGNPTALHAAAARAHAAAAQNTRGAARDRHRLAADYHAGRASKLSEGKRARRSDKDRVDEHLGKRTRKRITGPDHSLEAPVMAERDKRRKRAKTKCP